jgi:hypothetical protein
MLRFAELMAEHKEEVARTITREMGKVLKESRGDAQEGIDTALCLCPQECSGGSTANSAAFLNPTRTASGSVRRADEACWTQMRSGKERTG